MLFVGSTVTESPTFTVPVVSTTVTSPAAVSTTALVPLSFVARTTAAGAGAGEGAGAAGAGAGAAAVTTVLATGSTSMMLSIAVPAGAVTE